MNAAFGIAFLCSSSLLASPPAAETYDTPQWSAEVAGVQAKVTLVQKEKYNGTRQLVAYLELKNVSSSAHPIKIPCGEGHVKFELVDAKGKVALRATIKSDLKEPHPDFFWKGTIATPLVRVDWKD